MINYNFAAENVPAIVARAKPLTLRRPRKPPSRHAFIGDPVGLWAGMRTKQARRLAVGLCIMRGLIRFDAKGLHTISELKVKDALDPAVINIEATLSAQPDAFAKLDGFPNWALAWAWHDAHRTPEEKGAKSLCRDLIAWRYLPPEAEAEITSGAAQLEAA